MRLWQRLAGRGGMIAFFLLPNMAVFALFVIVPLGINVAYSLSGGTQLFLPSRSFVGPENFARLLTCDNHLAPATCRDDLFWIAVWNTVRFVALQVVVLVAVGKRRNLAKFIVYLVALAGGQWIAFRHADARRPTATRKPKASPSAEIGPL